MTEWVEDMEPTEFLEELGSQFRQEAEKQGFSRDECVMGFIGDQLTLYDCEKLLPRLVAWMLQEVRREERIGKGTN